MWSERRDPPHAAPEHIDRQAHLGDERRCELEHLEQLDAHTQREEELGLAVLAHQPPIIEVALGGMGGRM